MKKLVLMFVAVAAISFASCGNKANQGPEVDSDSIVIPDIYENDSTNDSINKDSIKTANDSINAKI